MRSVTTSARAALSLEEVLSIDSSRVGESEPAKEYSEIADVDAGDKVGASGKVLSVEFCP